jgi:hypothetical protein
MVKALPGLPRTCDGEAMRMSLATLLLAATVVVSLATGPSEWTPKSWADEDTVELRTTNPGEEPYWFKVWLVTIDGQLYVRLGSRAGARYEGNTTKPILGVRIAGKTFERVRAVEAPDMAGKVEAAMADKYWLQADFIIRRLSHPYTLRLEPEAAS